MVGATDVHTGTDNPKTPLGTTVTWTDKQVVDIDGTCQIVRASVTPVSIDTLEHSVWGGQPVGGLELPKTTIAKIFRRTTIPIFDDGGKQCSQAVALSMNRILLMFQNGYLYVLDRDVRKQ